jgi:hypothetical protein
VVILDLVRVMGGIAIGALAEVTIRSAAERELADRWCARTGNTIVGADIDDSGVGTLVVRRGRLPDPAVDLGRDRMPGARLWLYTNFHSRDRPERSGQLADRTIGALPRRDCQVVRRAVDESIHGRRVVPLRMNSFGVSTPCAGRRACRPRSGVVSGVH